ncbi:hypothetical protein KGM_203064 [Danaus plexippus plexippus]|uniref:Uncharacterized protein n=1 Tax=Danaus plexippus plexippus TaxID=278856 RepID=A0A212FDH4_DANPL|nr:hypothetical protein KGM_203064 [Danaus plexippus plexippus]
MKLMFFIIICIIITRGSSKATIAVGVDTDERKLKLRYGLLPRGLFSLTEMLEDDRVPSYRRCSMENRNANGRPGVVGFVMDTILDSTI